MDLIAGYPADALRAQLLDRMDECTPSSIERRLRSVEARLATITAPILLSLGENCAAGVKLREAGLAALGGSFFDNLVAPVDSAIRLFDEDFAQLLQLRNLIVGQWEQQDFVLDIRYGIFFHHYFHLRGEGLEKDDLSQGFRRRRIDEADIPLFLPAVLAQFEYLAAKMRLVLRAPQPKLLVLRMLDAGPAHAGATMRLRLALRRFGARNTDLRVVHARPLAPQDACEPASHVLVPEDGERWGVAAAWRALVLP